MQTSVQWLDSVKINKYKFNNWLSQQWLAEVKAAQEIKILSDNAEDKHKKVLLKISSDESKHANLLKELCEKRNLTIAKDSSNRYYDNIKLQSLSQDELYAIGHYAEGMRLSRIRAICNDPEIDFDIRVSFSNILKDEIMHEKAFKRITSESALSAMRGKHDLGVAALGLSL
jgi:rubrerythrin